jgi:putative ABC transport system ATP-binding protein
MTYTEDPSSTETPGPYADTGALLSRPPVPAVRIEHVSKVYRSSTQPVTALDDVTVLLPRGSFTAVMGPSGSGKSTLLQCAAGLDRPSSGRIFLGDTETTGLSPKASTVFRRDHVGFVFQSYNLLPHLSVAQNITLPMLLGGAVADPDWFDHVVASVGLADFTTRRPQELSGGQQQRAAIARALITRPAAIFADEPTGALDSGTGRQVLDLLQQTAAELDQTVLMVTHDALAASYADRVLFLTDGRVVGHLDHPDVAQVAARMTGLGGR